MSRHTRVSIFQRQKSKSCFSRSWRKRVSPWMAAALAFCQIGLSEGGEEAGDQVVVMFGDSTTAFRPGAVEKVYSERIQDSLTKNGEAIRVLNRGVGGDTTARAKKRFDKDVLAENPAVVVMQFGINDAAVDVWKDPPNTGPRVSRDEYRSNLRAMIEEAHEAGADVILMTPNPLRWQEKMRQRYGKPPYDPDDPEGFEKPFFRGHVEAMRSLAEAMDIPLVDIHALYLERETRTGSPPDELLLDGVHPNDAGHALVAEALLPELRLALKNRD